MIRCVLANAEYGDSIPRGSSHKADGARSIQWAEASSLWTNPWPPLHLGDPFVTHEIDLDSSCLELLYLSAVFDRKWFSVSEGNNQ